VVVEVPDSGALTVRVTDRADGWVSADAWRIEQAYLPKVQVSVDLPDYLEPNPQDPDVPDRMLQSGEVYEFGDVLDLTDTTTVFTVENRGILPLALDDFTLNVGNQSVNAADDGVPVAGGVQVDRDGITDVVSKPGGDQRPAAPKMVTVSLNTDAVLGDPPRNYDGEIAFTTIDVGVPVFRLPVTGRVSQDSIVDNDDAGFSVTGDDYELQIRDTQFVGNDVHYGRAGDGSSVAQWTIPGVTAGMVYDISATWVAGENHASNAVYTILGGAAPIDVTVDQRVAPDGTGGGDIWQHLSPVTATGTEITVQLSNDADNWLVADAVKLTVPDALQLSQDELIGSQTAALSDAEVAPVLSAAIAEWQSAGLTAPEAARLSNVEVIVTPLPNEILGLASTQAPTIWLDTNAAGHGWNLSRELGAASGEPDVGHVDLLTVLAHELGHVIGREHGDDGQGVMAARLDTGVRALPVSQEPVASDPLSVINDQLFSGSLLPAFDLPLTSGIEERASGLPSSTHGDPLFALDVSDAVFASLDDEANVRNDDAVVEDESDEEDDGHPEDGLDLWSVLHGLDS
jgi:hypothetical protein